MLRYLRAALRKYYIIDILVIMITLVIILDTVNDVNYYYNEPVSVSTVHKPMVLPNKTRTHHDARIRNLPDHRSQHCKSFVYDRNATASVSIIANFFDYELIELRMTLDSIEMYSPPGVIKEIILIDDGSVLDRIKTTLQKVEGTNKKYRIFTQKRRKGRMEARNMAAKVATGTVLVFVDSRTIVTKGWLEPMLHYIRSNPYSFVMPHFDKIRDPVSYIYQTKPDGQVSSVWWTGLLPSSIRNINNHPVNNLPIIPSPTVRGPVFAVRRDFWAKLGGYNNMLNDFVAANLDLSWRMWLCGNGVFTITCSKVGLVDIEAPMMVLNGTQFEYLIELYMGKHKDMVKSIRQQIMLRHPQGQTFSNSIGTFGGMLNKTKQRMVKEKCKDFDWYVENIVPELKVMPSDYQVGFLKSVSGQSCIRIADEDNLEMGPCASNFKHTIPWHMLFEIDQDGRIRVAGKCVDKKDDHFLTVKQCNSETSQLWTYDLSKRIHNKGNNLCIIHSTHPDTLKQLPMFGDCKMYNNLKKRKYTIWEFIHV